MILETFRHNGRPPSNKLVEVLLEKWDGNSWKIQLARWCEHRGVWVHEWSGRPILDDIAGWREVTTCGCEAKAKSAA
ncbi:hypothetical protein [Methylobacterium sp. WL120]|uniref:hypothetical protein n=1 Tax=Methylobacterium sp. WL120 TaxID=2603887 RepID=UPI0011C6FDD6|nr:hypothetical protein [Methylobacterium sp. WL120]TXM69601.1 hypothetical protein FV229_04455 [Methylobacterium sp. WL120]